MAAFCGTADARPHTKAAPMHSSASSPEGISGATISNGAAVAKSIVEARTLASLHRLASHSANSVPKKAPASEDTRNTRLIHLPILASLQPYVRIRNGARQT